MKSQQTFSVIFLARKGKANSTNSLIYARISVNGQRCEFSLKQKIPSEIWDKNRGQVKGNSTEARRINQYLSQINAELFEAYDELRKNNEVITANAIKARFLKIDINTSTLVGAVEYHYKSFRRI